VTPNVIISQFNEQASKSFNLFQFMQNMTPLFFMNFTLKRDPKSPKISLNYINYISIIFREEGGPQWHICRTTCGPRVWDPGSYSFTHSVVFLSSRYFKSNFDCWESVTDPGNTTTMGLIRKTYSSEILKGKWEKHSNLFCEISCY